ncbi:MAG: hypothetical protein EBS21_11015, partial [Sphingomonadaceae bacterium]|nr:hypothetical protein [Sphingomonadaceae bacterium]
TISEGGISANGRDALGGNVSLTASTINLLGNISTTANTSNAAKSGGTITLTGATVLNGDRILTTGATSGGDILFLGTVDALGSAYNLTLTSGTGSIRFAGVVGGDVSLTAPGLISVSSATDVSFEAAVTAGGFQQLAGSNLTLVSGTTTLANGFSFTGTKLTIAGAVSTGSGFTVANSGLFTTSANGDITAGSAFSQTGSGLNSLSGDISTTNANISLAQAVTLTGDVSFWSSGGSITLLSTVDSGDASARAITLSSGSGNVTFSDKLGATRALGSITVNSAGTTKFVTTVKAGSVSTDAAGSTEVFANILTTDDQFYQDVLTLKADVTLTAATVKAYGSLSGGSKTLSIVGNAELGNPNGTNDTVTGLASLDVSGTTLIETATLTSTGTQNFQSDVTLGTTTTLTTTNSAITFGTALDSAATESNALTVAAGTGAVTFTGAVGAKTDGRLGHVSIGSDGITAFKGNVYAFSLETNVGGTTKLAGTVDTTTTQVFNDLLVLTGGVTLTGTDITLGQTINSDASATARALTVSGSGTTTFGGTVGATALLSSLTVNGGGTTNLNGASMTTSGAQTYDDSLVLGHDIVLTGSNITLNNSVNSDDALTPRALTVTGTGAKTFNAALGSTKVLGALIVNGGGTTALNGGIIKTSGAQTYTDAVTLGAGTLLSSSGGNISFSATLQSNTTPRSLEITAGSGDVSFTGAVGTQSMGLGDIVLNSADDVTFTAALQAASFEQKAGTGLTKLDSATNLGGYFKFAGNALTLNAGVTATGDVVIANDADFTTAADGDIRSAKVTQSGAGANKLSGDLLTTDDISFASAVELTGNVVATVSGTHTISFASTIDSSTNVARNLTLSAGQDILLSGVLGGTKKLGALALNGFGITRLGSAVTATSVASDASGTIELFGDVTTTGGTQTYADSELQLKSNVTLTGTTVTVGKIVGEAHALAITGNAQLGTVGGSDTVTGLSNLSVSGTTALAARSITSTGTQTYTGAVTLGRDTVLTGAGISFVNTLNGAKALTITDTATTIFGGVVGGTTRLTSLLITGDGITRINGGVVKTDLAQTYSNAVVLGAATTL